MSRGAYTPQPGTIPHRVVKFLHAQKDLGRIWVPAAELAEHVGQASVAPYLEAPLKHGVLVRRAVPSNNRLSEYALGDGKPLPRPEDLEPDEPLHPAAPIVVRPGALLPVAVDTPPAHAQRRAQRARPASSELLRAGLFLDGSMLLELDGQQVTLGRDQVLELARLLRGVAA